MKSLLFCAASGAVGMDHALRSSCARLVFHCRITAPVVCQAHHSDLRVLSWFPHPIQVGLLSLHKLAGVSPPGVAANVGLVERHDEDCGLSFLKRTAISGEINQRYIAVE